MICPNCGLNNPDNARFCGNCGTTLGSGAPPPSTPPQGQWQYQAPPPAGNSMGKNIAIGCLVAVLIVILFGLSCTRACFRHRRYYRYGVTPAVNVHQPAPSAYRV